MKQQRIQFRVLTRTTLPSGGYDGGACRVVGITVRPDVATIGWKTLLETLGDPSSRVRIVVDHNFELLDLPLGDLPALVPYEFAKPWDVEQGSTVQGQGAHWEVDLPKGWSADLKLEVSVPNVCAWVQQVAVYDLESS